MKDTLKSGLTIGMLVAALALTGGCGDNDNSSGEDNDNNDNSTPVSTRTVTPGPQVTPTTGATATGGVTATATPAPGATQNVTFDFTATEGIQGFQVNVTYPTAKGSFTGSGSGVGCTLTGGGGAIFTKNDKDDGNLVLSVAAAENLTFPISIACTFDATATITSSDLALTVEEVTQNNTSGNKAALGSTITVAP